MARWLKGRHWGTAGAGLSAEDVSSRMFVVTTAIVSPCDRTTTILCCGILSKKNKNQYPQNCFYFGQQKLGHYGIFAEGTVYKLPSILQFFNPFAKPYSLKK